MNESPWSDEGATAPKKKLLPTWAWWVGGGCLVLLLIAGIGGFFAFRFVKQAAQEWQDPELQWEKLKQVLPYDQRPEELDFQQSWHVFGSDGWIFMDRRGYLVMLMQMPESNARQTREKLLDPGESHGFMGKFGRHGQTRMKLKVQGRELEALRFVQEGADGGGAGEQSTGPGATVIVDLTPEDAIRPLFLQLTRSNRSDEPLDEQVVIDFLEPFHVGNQR